jgi:hypothetical protein
MDFEEWLNQSQSARDSFIAHAASVIPTEYGQLDIDIDESIRHSDVAGDQLVDIEWYLTKAIEESWVSIDPLGQMSVKEKETRTAAKVADIQRLHDRIDNKCRILNARIRASIERRRKM